MVLGITLSHTTKVGLVVDHWVISHINMNTKEEKVTVVVDCYKDQATYLEDPNNNVQNESKVFKYDTDQLIDTTKNVKCMSYDLVIEEEFFDTGTLVIDD